MKQIHQMVFSLLRTQRATWALLVLPAILAAGLWLTSKIAVDNATAGFRAQEAIFLIGLVDGTPAGKAAIYNNPFYYGRFDMAYEDVRIIPESSIPRAREIENQYWESQTGINDLIMSGARGNRHIIATRKELEADLTHALSEASGLPRVVMLEWSLLAMLAAALAVCLGLTGPQRRSTARIDLSEWTGERVAGLYATLTLLVVAVAVACWAVFSWWLESSEARHLAEFSDRWPGFVLLAVVGTVLVDYAIGIYRGFRSLASLPEISVRIARTISPLQGIVRRRALRKEIRTVESHLDALRRVAPDDPGLEDHQRQLDSLVGAESSLDKPPLSDEIESAARVLAAAHRDLDEIQRHEPAETTLAAARARVLESRTALAANLSTSKRPWAIEYFEAPALAEAQSLRSTLTGWINRIRQRRDGWSEWTEGLDSDDPPDLSEGSEESSEDEPLDDWRPARRRVTPRIILVAAATVVLVAIGLVVTGRDTNGPTQPPPEPRLSLEPSPGVAADCYQSQPLLCDPSRLDGLERIAEPLLSALEGTGTSRECLSLLFFAGDGPPMLGVSLEGLRPGCGNEPRDEERLRLLAAVVDQEIAEFPESLRIDLFPEGSKVQVTAGLGEAVVFAPGDLVREPQPPSRHGEGAHRDAHHEAVAPATTLDQEAAVPRELLRCATSRHLVVVDEPPGGRGLRYRSWSQPSTGVGTPALELLGGTQEAEGTAPCSHMYFNFTNGRYTYRVGGFGCTENKDLFDADEALRVWRGDELLLEAACRE